MSTVNAEVIAQHAPPREQPEVRIYSHSSILYWWPVWLLGYIMAALTYAEGSRAAIVPKGAIYDQAHHAIVLPANHAHPNARIGELSAQSKNVGVVFTMVLLMVIFISNTPLRGLWSGIALLTVAVVTVTFAWLGIWATILNHLG